MHVSFELQEKFFFHQQQTNMTLPSLPYQEWASTQKTLHLFLQILGKIRLKHMPRKNHWWYITLYPNSKGFTTQSMPFNNGLDQFEIQLNVVDHKIEMFSSQGKSYSFPIEDGLSVAQFYEELFRGLNILGLAVKIKSEPYDLPPAKDFSAITEYNSCDKEYIERFWKIMLWVDGVFKEFSGRYYGKTSPVHLFWHHMDLAITRFSGKKAQPLPSEKPTSDKEAYSHEVISFGFWAGDPEVTYPAFYSYTYPSPAGLDQEPLAPSAAKWIESGGSPLALLSYDDIRSKDNPREALLSFLESAYQAGAKKAGWNREEMSVPPLAEL